MNRNLISVLLVPVLLISPGLPAMGAETAEVTETADSIVYGEPWLTSIVDGMVTTDLEKPDLKDDFYLNNNYDWLRDTALKPNHSRAGGIFDLEDLTDERTASLLTDESIPGREADLVREYYQMILDWESREKGGEFFLAHLKPIQDIATLEDLTAYLTSEECMYYGHSLGEPSLEKHVAHPEDWMIDFATTTLTLRDSAEYAERTPSGERMGEYFDGKASYMLQYAGYSEDEAAELIRQCHEFETLLAPSIISDQEDNEADAVERKFNIYTREELEAASPVFPVTAILDLYAFNPELEINLQQPAWLEKLNELYTEENVPLIRAYLLYTRAHLAIEYLDEAAFQESQKLSAAFYGYEEDSDVIAIELTLTALQQFVDEMYVEKYCTEKMREDILSVMQEILTVYREMLQEETWLAEETREKAIKKLDTMDLNAAYPESREDWTGITFRSRSEGGSLWEATCELWRCKLDLMRKNSFGSPASDLWSEPSYNVNAQYVLQNNSINICAGILNGDVYREDMTLEELLAGAGMVIAHEISHAFDAEGSLFDETGALRNWWTDADQAAFERRIGKLVTYYDSLYPWKDGSPYSGVLVQEEATADLGAMACILRIAKKTEGFNYDAFFRSYAQLRRCKMTEIALEGYHHNPHPMEHMRVNVLVAQFPEFQETYDIQPGDGMYVASEDRIAIWGMPDTDE